MANKYLFHLPWWSIFSIFLTIYTQHIFFCFVFFALCLQNNQSVHQIGGLAGPPAGDHCPQGSSNHFSNHYKFNKEGALLWNVPESCVIWERGAGQPADFDKHSTASFSTNAGSESHPRQEEQCRNIFPAFYDCHKDQLLHSSICLRYIIIVIKFPFLVQTGQN